MLDLIDYGGIFGIGKADGYFMSINTNLFFRLLVVHRITSCVKLNFKSSRAGKCCVRIHRAGGIPARLKLFRFDAFSPYLPRSPGEGGYCKPPLAGLS